MCVLFSMVTAYILLCFVVGSELHGVQSEVVIHWAAKKVVVSDLGWGDAFDFWAKRLLSILYSTPFK